MQGVCGPDTGLRSPRCSREITMPSYEKKEQGPNGSAKRRAPEEQQTATSKVEAVRVLAKANQNRAREMETPGQLEDAKCGVHRPLN